MVDWSKVDVSNLTGAPNVSWNFSEPFNATLNLTDQFKLLNNISNFSHPVLLEPVKMMMVDWTNGVGLFALFVTFIGFAYVKTQRFEAVAVISLLLGMALTMINLAFPLFKPIQMFVMWVFILSFAAILYLLYKER